MYLVVTNSCQLHCSFCYNSYAPLFKEKDNTLINPIKTAKVIDKLGVKEVIFHGGEPLLYPETLISVMEHTKNKVLFTIQSNLAYDNLSKKQIEALCMTRCYGTSYNPKEVMKYLTCELGFDSIIIERVIYPIQDQLKDIKKYKEIYEAIDKYMLLLYKLAPDKKKVSLYHAVKNCIQNGTSFFPHNCHEFTCTLNNKKLLSGCPSLETNIEYGKRKEECSKCNLYQFCQEDCECMRIVCAFPKKTFGYIATDIIEELDES